MDYDENDFQSQNFQLVGEDNKFSTNLRSFPLPKFDLDEHLRFDSLVETDALLGIQNQGNNWIEFPSANTAVEFSSSAAESCLISRHNNVWSEATSSESVDLLLKSVREDELINNKAVIMESINNDGFHVVDTQVNVDEKKFNEDNIQDECPENLSSEGQGEVLTHLQGSSQASKVEELKSVVNIDRSNEKCSFDGKIAGENVASLLDVDKSRVVNEVLCNTVMKGHDSSRLMRTNGSNIDDCNTRVAANHSSLSNSSRLHDERLVDATGLFAEQNTGNFTSSFDLLYETSHNEKSFVIHCGKAENQLVSSSDALALPKTRSDSVISEDADGLVSISCKTKPLMHDCIKSTKFYEKQGVAFNLSVEKSAKSENNSAIISRLPDDSEEDDDAYNINNQNLTSSCDGEGKLVACNDASSNKQFPEGEMAENNNVDINAESNASIQANYEIKVSQTGDKHLSIACENSGLVVEDKIDEDIDTDRREVKSDVDKDIAQNESSILHFPDAEAKFSSFNILEQEESDSVPFSQNFEKSMHLHLPPSEDVTAIDVSVTKEEPLTEAPSSSDIIRSSDKDSKNEASDVEKLPLPVKSVDFSQAQNEAASSTIGAVSHGSGGDDNAIKSRDGFLNMRNETLVVSDNVLFTNMNDSSQTCIMSTVESNPSEKKSFCASPAANLEHEDDKLPHLECNLGSSSIKASISSEKDEVSRNPHDASIEVKSFTSELSTSGNSSKSGAASEEKSFPSLKSIDIRQENDRGCQDEAKQPEISAKSPVKRKGRNLSMVSNEKKTGSSGRTKKGPALKQVSEMDAGYYSGQQKYAETSSKDSPFVDSRELSSIESCTIKASSSMVVQTASIPDLNSSSSTLFQPSFTDKQQLQLRAQIFVYGALNSGILPDEACMASAFGDTDGGRRLWEELWHSLIMKFQNQESPVSGYETPSHSRLVGTNVQNKISESAAAKSSGKVISSTVPFPSPLWSLSHGNGHHAGLPMGTHLNFSQTTSPLTPWRPPPQFRQHVDANSPWFSQSTHHPGPWFPSSSHTSAFNGGKHYSTVPFTESMRVTPAMQAAPGVLMSAADPTATITTTTMTPVVMRMETKKNAGASESSKNASKSQKGRKTKGLAAKETTLPVSRTSLESIPVLSGIECLPLPSASMPQSSNSPLKVANGASISVGMPNIFSLSKANFSEETCSRVEVAKLHAEDAAAIAASSIKHCRAIWSQLASQKNSGLVSQVEEKLASAAVAAAAAASVAKAAAAAAKVASDVALQAKLMADEAVITAKMGNSDIFDVGKKLAGFTPISILKGMDRIHESVDVISAAREAAKRRIESASAATKHAENLDAIVKAAELAAEAVAQAGTLITLGEPLPFTLSELVDAGTEDFWKAHRGALLNFSKPSDIHGDAHVAGNVKESAKRFDEQLLKDEKSKTIASYGELSSSVKSREELDGKTQGNFPTPGHETDHSICNLNIQKGSLVEVMSEEDGIGRAWFSAKVLEVKDNKTFVCYNDVLTNEGHLKEWIVLENEREKAPRIRTPHPATAMKHPGTKKRRREHLGSFIWQLGDHVDAWIHDRWWEGVVSEKNPGDETKLTVHFPAKGDKQAVHAWNVRPSLIWKDGQWMEWSRSTERSLKPHEGDTPHEKRQRLDKVVPTTNSKNMLTNISRKPEDLKPLALSAKDRTFTIGKNSRDEATSNAPKMKPGSQQEGSRVVFGVPRPGKKRKFMEVSKHYVAEKREKVREGGDPIKFAKYLMPQASQKFKNTAKVGYKGNRLGDNKSRVGVKTENSHGIQTRSQSDAVLLTAPNGEAGHENDKNGISSFNLEKMNTVKNGGFQCHAEGSKALAMELEPPAQPASNVLLSKKKNALGSESGLSVKAKPTPSRGFKVADKGIGNHGKAIGESTEPRRSNRRIQPTSRLLEGIQSSLIISKLSNISHDKKSSRGNAHG